MFNENTYYSKFKKIRNQFRKYSSESLIIHSLKYLHTPSKNDAEKLKRHPWLVLLFIKWVVIDEDYPNIRGKEANNENTYNLLQSVYLLNDELRPPDEYEHLILFIRNIAFQQFPYQTQFRFSHISRQVILFSSLEKAHYISTRFKQHTGIEIQEYLELSIITIARFENLQHSSISEQWFSSIFHKYSEQTVKKFLSLISKDLQNARDAILLKYTDKKRYLSAESYGLTPFINYPFIKLENNYLLTNKHILFRHCEYFIYDKMREINAEKFMNKFGKMFEKYIEKSIIYSEVKYITEQSIQKIFGLSGKQIDFIVQESEANIFIDAKAVEMSHRGQTTHSSKMLHHATRDSIFKAIEQSHNVLQKIESGNHGEVPAKDNNYLLVITFKELWLGSGSTYYEVVAKDNMDKIYQKYSQNTHIPKENIYFITIDDFDIMAKMLKDKISTLRNIIEKAKSNDEYPESKKFDFQGHLSSINKALEIPEFLAIEQQRALDKLGKILQNK